MQFFLQSNKDASIYSDYQMQNTGLDAILNLFKIKDDIFYINTRLLLTYDVSVLSASISDGSIVNPTFNLELSTTDLKELPASFTLDVHPVLNSWDMGLGKRQDLPKTTDGVSWLYRDYLGGLEWNTPGGDYITGSKASFQFDTQAIDVKFNVTDIVMGWIDGTYDNNGFLIKYTNAEETDEKNYGEVNFFSSDTNTIYRPKLSIRWDDSQQVTGSIVEVTDENTFCVVSNLKSQYKTNNTYKFRLRSRPNFVQPIFGDTSPYSVLYRLPPTSYYSIIDNVTKDVIIPFSEFSKISCDEFGSYFNQNFVGWEPERFYRIIIKIIASDGSIQYIDKNFTFNLIE